MSFIEIENGITNLNFFILFITMLLYWFQSSSLISSKWLFFSTLSIFFSNFLQIIFLCLRWVGSKHFPLSNLYESLLFLSWVLTFILVVFNLKQKTPPLKQVKNKLNLGVARSDLKDQSNLIDPLIGSILTPFILLINTFASFLLPNELKITTALVPALQSNWLVMHVTVMMLSYGALLSGCLLAICYLIIVFFSPTSSLAQQTNQMTFNSCKSEGSKSEKSKLATLESSTQLNWANEIQNSDQPAFISLLPATLDNLSYRILSLGFPLLTIGILSGAVWANQTWGSYWSWDPKETWALITWFVFAIYLHTRISKGWTGKKSALIASFGFIIIWICYLGVNLLGKGLHSYGFFS
jgi:cytochrome c-type biogenesis protein CcsB